MSINTTYNGWTNRETWLVKLWLDEYGYEPSGTSISQIQSDVEELYLGDQDASLKTDLVNQALSHVNWVEIFNSYNE